jgi:hypothetical protein
MKQDDFYSQKRVSDLDATPFENAEEAWFWFMLAQQAKNDGARVGGGRALAVRPCEPADILKCLDRLYRNRMLSMDHMLVLRHYGKRQIAPDLRRIKEVQAYKLWSEAMDRLEPVLKRKGIICSEQSMASRPGRFWAQSAMMFEGGLGA